MRNQRIFKKDFSNEFLRVFTGTILKWFHGLFLCFHREKALFSSEASFYRRFFFCLVTCYKPSRRLRKSSVRMLPSSLFSPPCTPQTPYGSFVTALSVSRVSQPPSSILQVKAPNGRCCSYPISCLSYHPYPRLLPSLSLLLSDYLPNPRKRFLLTGLLATRTYSYYTLPFFTDETVPGK